jgi:hypothetical protein
MLLVVVWYVTSVLIGLGAMVVKVLDDVYVVST